LGTKSTSQRTKNKNIYKKIKKLEIKGKIEEENSERNI
jgi:hypothetical protein